MESKRKINKTTESEILKARTREENKIELKIFTEREADRQR